MAFKVFLDANVLLDFLLKRKGYEDARTIIQLVTERKIQACISPAIIHIVSYWLTKSYGKPTTRDLLLLLLSDIRVIDCTHDVAIFALHSKIDDVEDALQYYTAIQHKLDVFISSDRVLQGLGTVQLPVRSVREFLQMV
ncbi:putative toxin-antitoxin system toxin component, PIN family [Dyadobacter sp. MSC1_007]|jgi:putative PIN family toxin of toxin-antitoxin system|uniref:putative toxin-antitoxin system toxin component, PIN family n=1 Tax=Dyadobacter sp. MSC1_007 TaxID=2909264 RepID=UPI00202F8679|nr:putative toxin-antitoxin system toxin component, PIN family [Dyadobacter sp. MSC1_007]